MGSKKVFVKFSFRPYGFQKAFSEPRATTCFLSTILKLNGFGRNVFVIYFTEFINKRFIG